MIVRNYDEAIAFFVGKLGFELREDTPLTAEKRWVVVGPVGSDHGLLLARAVDDKQRQAVGDQSGGRVFLFLETDDFARDHAAYVGRGVRFIGPARQESYGKVAVFEDLYGNRWDLIEKPPVADRHPQLTEQPVGLGSTRKACRYLLIVERRNLGMRGWPRVRGGKVSPRCRPESVDRPAGDRRHSASVRKRGKGGAIGPGAEIVGGILLRSYVRSALRPPVVTEMEMRWAFATKHRPGDVSASTVEERS